MLRHFSGWFLVRLGGVPTDLLSQLLGFLSWVCSVRGVFAVVMTLARDLNIVEVINADLRI
jgi:hypothetical protein